MEQYFSMKAKHPDAIMLFRVGDFYETFGEDAIKASKILGIILTARNNGSSKIELAGFPHHSLDIYLPKLVRSGHRVAICDQLEKPSKEKKIVRRGVTEVVTPGVTIDDKILDHRSNNYLASLYFVQSSHIGLSLLDLSTGEFLLTEGDHYEIDKLLRSFQPNEVLVQKSQLRAFAQLFGESLFTYPLDDWIYTDEFAPPLLKKQFDVARLKGFGIEDMMLGQVAAGSILHYLEVTENHQTAHINTIKRLESDESVWLDRFTIRNLELIDSMHADGKSLFDILDDTATPMGARMLKKMILFPLLDLRQIKSRHETVAALIDQISLTENLYITLKSIGDLERLISKVALAKVHPKELLHILKALKSLPEIRITLAELNLLDKTLLDGLKGGETALQIIEESIHPDAPIQLSKGMVIREGYDKQLDEYRSVVSNAKDLLVDIQTVEAERTGIASLKIGFNNVFGYYLEVTNKYKNQGLIPENWVRKQTLTNAERYITDELKTLEQKILSAQDQISGLEEELYRSVVSRLATHIYEIQRQADCLAQLDVLVNFARLAIDRQYVQPEIHDGLALEIKDARHPVIELQLPDTEHYIPNDLVLDPTSEQILMITGPNMSGKSALLRQSALIVLMAQIGSFVPASSARIGLVDKVFTRVGASDNISSGESTFMVEMSETASIMNNISPRSLVLLDEIGRGTSTYDGISIAWSIAEYLHTHKQCQPKTLFATHYHELNQLAALYPRIKNYHVSTRETGSKVIFLRKLVEGGSEHSFGIHVAKMAGMPPWIIKRAYKMLQDLEAQRMDGAELVEKVNPMSAGATQQLDLFGAATDPKAVALKEKIEKLDLNHMTPIEAMMKLNELKQSLWEE